MPGGSPDRQCLRSLPPLGQRPLAPVGPGLRARNEFPRVDMEPARGAVQPVVRRRDELFALRHTNGVMRFGRGHPTCSTANRGAAATGRTAGEWGKQSAGRGDPGTIGGSSASRFERGRPPLVAGRYPAVGAARPRGPVPHAGGPPGRGTPPRPGVAADRGAGRRRHQVRPLEPAGRDGPPAGRPSVGEPVAGRAGYQRTNEELGPGRSEGRSWRGFHHRAAMVMLAYGFLLPERDRGRAGAGGRPVPRFRTV